MKKIVLLCASGMSTSMLVKKMQEAAAAANYDCSIDAFSATDAAAPQIRFQKNKIAEQVPGVPVDAIDMRMYGRMDGKGALEFARKLMND